MLQTSPSYRLLSPHYNFKNSNASSFSFFTYISNFLGFYQQLCLIFYYLIHNKITMKSTIIFILVLYFFTEPALSANCALGCTDCVNVTICSACEETYTFIQRAEKCLKCPPNCLECTYASGDGFTCQTCTDDFELNSDGECFKCDPMCETCSNTPTNCTSCKEGLV